jgi:isoleucyl-tRNA synthetase
VHFETWPKYDLKVIDPILERQMQILRKFTEAATAAREKKGIKRRWPVLRIVFSPKNQEVKSALENLKNLAMTQTNTLRLDILEPNEKIGEISLKVEPNFEVIGPEFKDKAKKIASELTKIDPIEIKNKIKEGFKIKINGEKVLLFEKHMKFKEELPDKYMYSEFEYGTVYLDSERTDEILSLGYARELVRRIQEMRKEKDLDIEAFISAKIQVGNKKIVDLVKRQQNYISQETRARELKIAEELEHRGYTKEWEIENIRFVISIDEYK